MKAHEKPDWKFLSRRDKKPAVADDMMKIFVVFGFHPIRYIDLSHEVFGLQRSMTKPQPAFAQ